MIAESDNNAARVLSVHAPNNYLADVYGDFGLPVVTNEDENIISPKMYMRLFRILYNASYLGRGRSQQALELMTQTSFTDGIVAGVPQGTSVSHKFGEREIFVGSGKTPTLTQLHDCGIVYYPRFPYGICIMTEGGDLQKLKLVIAHVSQTIYEEVQHGALAQ